MRASLLILLVGCTEPLDESHQDTTLHVASVRYPCTKITGETKLCFAGKETGPYNLIGHDYQWGFDTELHGERDGDDFIVYQAVSTPDPVHTMTLLFPAPPEDGSSPWFTRSNSGLDLEGTLIPCDREHCDRIVAASTRVFSLTVQIAGPHTLDVVEIDPLTHD